MWSLLLFAAHAQDAVKLSVVRYATEGLSMPSVTFDVFVDGTLTANLACGGKDFHLKAGVVTGQSYKLDLSGLRRGAHTCAGDLSITASDGTSGTMPLSIGVEVFGPLVLTVDRKDLDLAKRRMVVRGNRPLSRVEVEAIGPGGAPVGFGEAAAGASDRIDLSWTGEGEVVKLSLKGWDTHELVGGVELMPWSYAIPHEDVVFASDSAAIAPSEVPKLEKAWTDIEAVRAKYGSVVPIRLFVAGYTDTVGDAAHNQTLSRDRAKALAAWFEQRGFDGAIAYQGFGEGALAVATGDAVDEPKNRRAVYLLAAEEPPLSADLPRSDWTSAP